MLTIYARQGIDLDRSTLADWVGRAAWLLRPRCMNAC
jgi:transposase